MITLNERLADTTEKTKDVVNMKHQQISPIDQGSNVYEQYLLKYGGSSRALDKYFALQRVGDNRYGAKYDGTT